MLASGQNWAKLWAAVQELPLVWSLRGLEHLVQAGWRPENTEEARLFADLKNLLEQGVIRDIQAAIKVIPLAYQRLKVNGTPGFGTGRRKKGRAVELAGSQN
jgi:hypothetical protein